MRLLFVKNSLVWPRSSGHDVHTYYMMKACADLGHEVSLATVTQPETAAVDGLRLKQHFALGESRPNVGRLPGTRLQRRFRSFWGVSPVRIAALQEAVGHAAPHAVVVVGLDALPYLPALSNVVRVWYAADEWVLHHLSQLEFRVASLREHANAAAVKGLYERAHRGVIDRAWVVSESDRRAMRWIAGVTNVDVVPNGVDGGFFSPSGVVPEGPTAVFWGRLDFGPNIQALQWFCRRVWPIVRRRASDARFTIIGFQPTDAVRALVTDDSISLQPNLEDLRDAVRRHSLAVMPFVSGAGIKNKLLEAAAMGMPIVGTATAMRGLRGDPPVVVGSTPNTLASAVVDLWNDVHRRRRLGVDARAWVLAHHTWAATAHAALASIEDGQTVAS